MKKFSDYFDSYEARSPLWQERVRKEGNAIPGLSAEKETRYERITENNYPKIYRAFQDECVYRNIEMPACYLDSSGRTVLGRAIAEDYSIVVDARADKIFDDKEMRALAAHEVKHLYQDQAKNSKDNQNCEYDCDRAAVTSTDYATVRSYVDKAIHMMIDASVPLPIFRTVMHKIHDAYPGFIAEHAWCSTNSWYPSPASRLQAMREHEQMHKEQDQGLNR